MATQSAVTAQGQEIPLPANNWVVGYTAAELATIQRQDPYLIIVSSWIVKRNQFMIQ